MKKDSTSHIDLDLRFFRRYRKEARCTILLEGRPVTARTVDYSLNGVGIVMEGSTSVNPGDDISLDSDELEVHERGRVVWAEMIHSGLRAGVLKTGPLKGSFRHYMLADILISLQRKSKTGILDVCRGPINKKVYIRNGNMIFAASNQDRDRLGDVLLKCRRMTRRQYDKAAEIKRKSGAPYISILVQMGYLKSAELVSIVELQARRIIGSLFGLRDGEFEFIEGPLPPKDMVALNLSVSDLMYRAVKKNANIELLENHLLDDVVDFSSTPLNLFQDRRITAADKMVLSYVDGKTGIRDIIRLCPPGHADPLKIIYALLEARILVIRGPGESPSGSDAGVECGCKGKSGNILTDEIEQMYAEYRSMDYYRILGVDRNADAGGIKKAYYRAAKKYHPDLHLGLPEEAQKKLLAVFTYITNAYLTLTDRTRREKNDEGVRPAGGETAVNAGTSEIYSGSEEHAGRRERDGRPDENETASAGNSETALLKFNDGKNKFRGRQFSEAARLFATAVYFDGAVPEYHYFYGRSLSMLGDLKGAAKALNRAYELKPQQSDILAELGHVYLKLGFPLRARGYFEKALKCDPSNESGREGMAIVSKMEDGEKPG